MSKKSVEEYQEFVYSLGGGDIDDTLYTHPLVTWMVRTFWLALGIWSLWHGLKEHTFVYAFVDYAILAFCLWRLLYQGLPQAFICKKGLILRRQPVDLRETLQSFGHGKELFVFVPYETIIGFSEGWNELQLTDSTSGGILVLSIDIKFVSYDDKMAMCNRIEQEKNHNE